MKRKLTALLLIICMIVTMVPTAAAEETKPRLSEMTDAEIEAFFEENGVVIPQVNYATEEQMFALARRVVIQVEQNPVIEFISSNEINHQLSLDIQEAVNDYYEIDLSQIPVIVSTDRLQQNVAYVLPVPSNVSNYRCYAFALEKETSVYPGDASNKSFSSVSGMANAVKADLKVYGYQCVKSTTSYMSSGDVIAARYNSGDYHFMRRGHKLGSGYWLHKPGDSTVLRFTGTMSDPWLQEGYGKNGYTNTGGYYTGQIYYIGFRNSHTSASSLATGDHYHSGSYHYYEYEHTCSYCGESYTTWTKVSCSGNCATINKENERIDWL